MPIEDGSTSPEPRRGGGDRFPLARMLPVPTESPTEWFGFGDEEAPPKPRLIGFDDEDLVVPAPPAPPLAEPRPRLLPPAPPPRRAPPSRAGAAARARPSAAIAAKKQPLLVAIALLLGYYAIFGRTGAYLGVPLGGANGIYIGEFVLAFGLLTLMVDGGYEHFFGLPIALPWLLFCIWNAAQTFPYVSRYGMSALRDGATWGYSLYTVIICSVLLSRPSGFVFLVQKYAAFARAYVFIALFLTPLSIYSATHGWQFEPIYLSTMGVHLAGALSFVGCGLIAVPRLWWWILPVEFVVIASHGRGPMLSFIAGALVLFLFYPSSMRRFGRVFGALGIVLALAVILNLNLKIQNFENREIGPSQLITNLVGSFGNTDEQSLDGTREWRLAWWNKIIDYTVYGPYFWTGKGYGINLADDDGFQVSDENSQEPLRSPHNSHLTFLARSGVPGFLLWLALQATWVFGVLQALLFARRTGRRRAAGILTFILAYWVAIMVDAATDVIIEGPFMGIWFWSLFGIGAAAARMLRRDPDFFERIDPAAAPATKGRRLPRPLAPVPAAARVR